MLYTPKTIKSENEQLRDEVWKMKRADRPPGGAAVTSHSEVSEAKSRYYLDNYLYHNNISCDLM